MRTDPRPTKSKFATMPALHKKALLTATHDGEAIPTETLAEFKDARAARRKVKFQAKVSKVSVPNGKSNAEKPASIPTDNSAA